MLDEIAECLTDRVRSVEQHEVTGVRNCNKLGARNLLVQALTIFNGRLLVFFAPDNQHWFAQILQIGGDGIDIGWDQEADMTEENLFTQFAIPGRDIIVDNS